MTVTQLADFRWGDPSGNDGVDRSGKLGTSEGSTALPNGRGRPDRLIEGVARGIDMFDCVLPTRLARHGTALTSTGRLAVKNASFARSDEPLDASCSCSTCSRHSRSYIRHLVSVGEQTAATLVTIHNLTYLHTLMQRARQSIIDGTFSPLHEEVNAVWLEGPGQGPGRAKQAAPDPASGTPGVSGVSGS